MINLKIICKSSPWEPFVISGETSDFDAAIPVVRPPMLADEALLSIIPGASNVS